MLSECAPQVSRTHTQIATGHDNNLGISVSTAGQTPSVSPAATDTSVSKQADTSLFGTRQRRQLRPRLAADLVTTALSIRDPQDTAETDEDNDVQYDGEAHVDLSDEWTYAAINDRAKELAEAENAARMASRATYRRGEVAAWRRVLPELPDSFVDAADALEAYAGQLAEGLTQIRADIDPAIRQLNDAQRSPTSFEITTDDTAMRGVWAGRTHWINLAEDTIDTARQQGVTIDCSPHNVRTLITALADFFDAAGHGCTASTATIVARAIDRHGATCAATTGARRLRTLTGVLIDADLLIVQAKGRHLTSIERTAARIHHGTRQKAAANHVDANVPAWLMPAPQPAPEAPAYADGLAERLAARAAADHRHSADVVTCEDAEPSTYTVGYGLLSCFCSSWVAHAGALTRANTENHTTDEKTPTGHFTDPTHHRPGRDNQPPSGSNTPVSLRARRIADDLTRRGTPHTLADGPYKHLCGAESHQMGKTTLARLIDAHTPSWAGTRDVLAALAHAATSAATGYVALGLHTRPDNASAWMTTVLTRIDWSDPDAFPDWWKTAEHFGMHWCGPRREWTNIG